MLSKIYEVFTKKYQDETKYREFIYDIIPEIKIKNKSRSIDEKMAFLSDDDYVSNFSIKLGECK